jgi:hypothetical protein
MGVVQSKNQARRASGGIVTDEMECDKGTRVDAEHEPLLNLVGLAGIGTDSPSDLAARHDEYLIQAQEENDGKRSAICGHS